MARRRSWARTHWQELVAIAATAGGAALVRPLVDALEALGVPSWSFLAFAVALPASAAMLLILHEAVKRRRKTHDQRILEPRTGAR